jgi:hypothetical protein
MKSEKFPLYILLALLAAFSFLFGYYAINTSFHYHYQHIAWQSNSLFLNYYLNFSGGLGEYVALFISQFFYSNLLGSFLIAVSGFLISFFLFKVFYLNLEKPRLLILLVPLVQIIFLALMCDYLYHYSITVNIIIVSGFLYLCALIDKNTSFTISFHTIVSGILIYYISGGMYFLIFLVSSLILIVGKPDKRMFINASLLITVAVVIPFIAHRYIFLSSLNNSFLRSAPDVAAMLRYSMPFLFYVGLAMIPAMLLFVKIFAVFSFTKKKTKIPEKNTGKSKTKIQQGLPSKFSKLNVAIAVQIFLLMAFSGTILYMVYKPLEKAKVEVDFYSNQQDWEKVIALCEKMDSYDRMVNFQYNRALLNTGQVLEKLFKYDQILGSQGLFLDKPFTSEVALPSSDIYFDLGNIDESQRYAFESETLMKNSPRVLKRLIINCIIMNNMEAANTYLNILAANPMENEWVDKYLSYINNPNMVATDSLIDRKRKDMSKTEGMYGSPPLKLLSQLEKNPLNKGAFEYLIAFDLLEHDVVSLTQDLKYLSKLNYQKLPVVLEEAIILYRSQMKNNMLLNLMRISESTTERFREFAKLTTAAKGDKEKAKQATLSFKNTYWYYVLFLSPKVTKLKLDTKPVEANY